jgi:hypothetical protein
MENLPQQQAPQPKGMMPMICAAASRAELVRHFANLTPEKVIENGYPSLARLKREHTIETVEAVVALLIVEGTAAFEKAIAKADAEELAAEICATYYCLTVEDCFVVMQRLRKAKLYGKLDPNKVLIAFDDYFNERMAIAENMTMNSHLAVVDKSTTHKGHAARLGDIAPPINKPNQRKWNDK